MIPIPRRFNRVLAGLTVATVFSVAITTPRIANATTFLWNVATPAANNWNVNANWNPNTGNPGVVDTALFGAIGTSPDALTINNVVSVNTAVSTLQYTNGLVGGTSFHVTQIPTGVTLTVATNFTETALGNVDAQNTYVTMTGGGTFFATSPTFIVGNNAATTGNAQATLDLSALNTFVYSNSTASMLIGWNQNRSRGTILFASASNNVTVGTFSLGIGGSSNGGTDNANLGGGTNIINANTINIIAGKSGGALQFQNGAGGLRIRGAGGTDSDRANMVVGNRTATGTGTTTGNVFLNAHPVDLKFGTLTVGQETAAVAVNGIGVFQFDTGTLDATAINIAVGTANAGATVTGTFTMGGGNLTVGSGGILLGLLTNGASATATLNINGGTAQLNGSIRKTNNTVNTATSTINISGATLNMVSGTIGTPDRLIDNLNLTSATLQLSPNYNLTNVVITSFNPVDGGNIVNIASVPPLLVYPTQFPLIAYSTLAGAGAINLGTLPGTFQGYVTNDTTLNTVFLVITNGPSTSKTDQWGGAVNNLWNTTTLNWTNAGAAVNYNEGDSVTFDDTATSSTVNVSSPHTPISVAVNNSALNYTFTGGGKISGATGLLKTGGLSLTLAETGGDDFTGGIQVNGGALILDNAGSAISGGLSVASGATAQIGNNDSNGNVPAGAIFDDGSLIFDRANNLTNSTPIQGAGSLVKIGNGVLTLNSTNAYSSDTFVFKGTLALIGSGSISNSPNVTVSNATLDISGVSSGFTILNNLSISNSVLALGTTNVQTPLNISSLTMGGSANTINVSALPPIASYPTTVTLVQSAGAIVGYNAVQGTLPPTYVGVISQSPDQTAILLTLSSGPVGTRQSVVWSGSDVPNLNTNWSDRLNWQLPGAPLPADNVVFGNTATVSDAVTINNIVDANTTVASLTYINSTSGQWHVTQIPTGVTLTVTNFTVGGLTADGLVTSVAMVDGGTLLAKGASFNVGNTGASASSANATADFSGLSNFVYAAAAGTFNVGNNGSRSIGNMNLAAASNLVTATTFNFEASAASSSVAATINLGSGTNVFNITSNNIGAQRSAGTLQFPGATGGIRWRGASGADSDRATMTLGLRNAGGTSGTSRGRLFFNDHPVDMKLSTLIMGQETANGSPIGAEGDIQFTMGTIDATTISMAIASGNAAATSVATLNVGTNATLGGNATLIVGAGGISLVNQTLGLSTGTINITGGAVISSGNIIKTTLAGTGSLSITGGGTLKMLSGVVGTPTIPIDSLNLDTATLQLSVNGNSVVTNIVATTITAADTTTINIGAVANVTAPATFSLISYTGTDPFPNLVLGTLPSGVAATLVDNVANATIDLNITAVAPSTPPTIQKITISGGNVVISGTNNAGAGGTFHVLTSTNLTLPLTNWTTLTNGTFDGSGNFSSTNAVDTTKPRGFYILQVP